MRFADADIEKARGMPRRKGFEPRTAAHRRRDRHHARIAVGQRCQCLAENLGVAAPPFRRSPGFQFKRTDPVPVAGTALGGLEAVPLLRGDVDQDRTLVVACRAEGVFQRIEVVTVDRSHITDAEFLEEGVAQPQALDRLFKAVVDAPQRRHAQPVAGRLGRRLDAVVAHVSQHTPEPTRQRSDVFRDRHLIVVEDHDELGVGVVQTVERLKRDAVGQRAVTDHGHDMLLTAVTVARDRHAQCGGERRAGVAAHKSIERALAGFGKLERPPC